MQLELEWQAPVPLTACREGDLIYTADLERFPRSAGIYVFARRWGRSYEALYVGRSLRIRGRIRGHLNNLRLMRHVEKARNGRRFVLHALPRLKGGQRIDSVLATLETTLIRHFLLAGHDLVNRQGVSIRHHEVVVRGPVPKAFVPGRIYLERGRGA